MNNVNMMLGKDIIRFLKSNNLIEKNGEIRIRCLFCNKKVRLDQIQFILRPLSENGAIRIVCSSAVCVEEFLSRGDEDA